MTSLEVWTPAKVNLYLELISKRADGFHELETVMVTVGLYDHLRFAKRSDCRVEVSCCGRDPTRTCEIPNGRRNLVWQAIDELSQAAGTKLGVDVSLTKAIPTQAGLGGGSSDAAATLMAVNRLFQLRFSKTRLSELSARLGSDIPFFFEAPAAICTGRGEKVQPVESNNTAWFVILMPPEGLSTAEVYRQSQIPSSLRSSHQILRALSSGDLRSLGKSLSNRLQRTGQQLSVWIGRIANEFQRAGALGHQMSGSGSSYFGLFGNFYTARRAQRLIRARLPQVQSFCVSGLGRLPLFTYHQAE